MEQRCRCIACNRSDTLAGYYCVSCGYGWEDEAYIDEEGNVRGSQCPRCLKMTEAEHIRCNQPSCMAVWSPPQRVA